MDNVDATAHYSLKVPTDLPSLLVVILDTNPYAWQTLSSTPDGGLPLSIAIGQLLVFINAHLAFSQTNKAAVIASHNDRAVFLSPAPPSANVNIIQVDSNRDANKYRVFRMIEDEVNASIANLFDDLTETSIEGVDGTNMAGALTMALAYINKTCFGGGRNALVAQDEKDRKVEGGADAGREMNARIVVASVSEDIASQYIPVMNGIFAAQRKKIPIDICKIYGDSVFLQQAADATGGIYMKLNDPRGLLQYLMMAFVADHASRQCLVPPTQVDVDFRAACFCHKRVLDIGFVCSICLSIFCSPPEGAICTTCTTKLDMSSLENFGKPAVVVKSAKKKKKKKVAAAPSGMNTGTNSAVDSPAP